MKRRDFLKAGVLGAAAIGAMSVAEPIRAFGKKSEKKLPKAKRVLMIALDGIRVDGFQQAHTPNLDALMAEGALSLNTRVVMPSITLPNWTSIFTGSGPELHGVGDNKWTLDNSTLQAVETDQDGYYPSVFKLLKDNVKNVKTAFYWNWKPLINSINKKYLDETNYLPNDGYVENYDRAFEFMKVNKDKPTVVFLYDVHTDHMGHRHNWMSPEYIKAIEEVDVEIGKLLERMKQEGIYEDTHIFFLSDHGGNGTSHRDFITAVMEVPWGLRGPGIKRGFIIEEPNNHMNTASVILKLFGIAQPQSWIGEIPYSIFK